MLTESIEGASKDVVLDEGHAQVHLGREEDHRDELCYLDTRASSHMTGCKLVFTELDIDVHGTVKFGDDSIVDICGHDTMLFTCQTDEHRTFTGMYYIPRLRSNIVSFGQLDENSC